MDKFNRSLLTEWRRLKLPFEAETFVIAVSGGADSVSLLAAVYELREAKKLRLNFIAAHFNHGLRGADSDGDAEFVETLAAKLNIEFVLGQAGALSGTGENLEQAARTARYGFLLDTARKHRASGVLAAHTINDQAETFLINLLRGSGVAGLGAMKPLRPFDENSETLLIRPLLNWAKRNDTETFARRRSIDFRADAMNEDQKFTRVRIRKNLIPVLSEYNPKIVDALARTAKLLQAEADRTAAGNPSPESAVLSVKDLKTLSTSVLYKRLRDWLGAQRGSLRGIDLKHVEAIERLIFSRKSGRRIELPGGGLVLKNSGKIFFTESKVEKSRSPN